MKQRGERWTMLIAHDTYAAAIVDDGGIPVLQYAHLHAAAHDVADDVVATDTFPGPEHTFASKA
ncbi:hypothetical protein [Cellulomonas flavigena]|nr:hypothetical protein [Cellulomonas flavigena]